ncbi:MAG: anti-sigma factor [Ferruginibacter sp.]
MEVKEIISSGLLELYAAGTASEIESKEVEQWVIQYPEVAIELNEISMSLESYAAANSIVPAAGVKEKIFANISTEKSSKVAEDFADVKGAKIIRTNTSWKWLAAACILLLIGSLTLNIFTYNRYSRANRDLLATRETLDDIQEKNKIIEAGMNVVQSKYSIPVALKGLDAAPDAAAKVFWMENTGEVFIDPSNLPEVPQGKQYQLWGIVDGKPVDGGMILTSLNGDKYRIQKMKTFGKVEAFAVTLENAAVKGSSSPKGPMFVLGKKS